MKDEEIRIAIADACGYERQVRSSMWWHSGLGKYFAPEELPDYLNDLNACHEMEKVLMPEKSCQKWWDYTDTLREIVPAGFGDTSMVHATARERCEAFLRTLNLWRDDR